jgi:transposase-like protein
VVYDKAWNVAYRRDRDAGQARYVDAAPVRSRLQGLVDAQVPLRTLGRVTGLSATTVRKILDGDQPRVQRATAARVARMSPRDVYLSQSTGHVPRIGAARRVQALLAMGWPHHALGDAGITNSAQIIGAAGELISIARWRQVRDVYDRLSMTPGPSPETRGWAAKLGYHPPLAWDEENIDDPRATPQHDAAPTTKNADVVDLVAVTRAADSPGTARTLTAQERTAVVRLMAARGASDTEIAEHLGVVDRTVLRWRTELKIPAGRPRSGTDTRWAEAEAREVTARPRPGRTPQRPGSAARRAVGEGQTRPAP